MLMDFKSYYFHHGSVVISLYSLTVGFSYFIVIKGNKFVYLVEKISISAKQIQFYTYTFITDINKIPNRYIIYNHNVSNCLYIYRNN